MPENFSAPPLPRYVRVVPELAVDKVFDYSIPPPLQPLLQLGHRLKVPWGRKEIAAYAVDFPLVPAVESCRDIIEVIGSEPLIPPSLLHLGRWMADYYCSDLPTTLKTLLPEAVRSKTSGHQERLWVSIPVHLVEEEVVATLHRAKVQAAAWIQAHRSGGGWLADLCRESNTTQAPWKALADRGFILLRKERQERSPFLKLDQLSQPLELNPEQIEVLERTFQEMEKPEPAPLLLQGVTGSGKTEVYLQALARLLRQGRNALILVPEISLTPQTVERFRARFEGEKIRVAVLHSHLSSGERHDQWHQIRSGKARIVIGARSAVFAPIQNLGLIIVDEEHEASYKQEEAPHYHARDIAVLRGRLEKVPVLLGSATPSLESIHNANLGKYRLVRLTRRVDVQELPIIHVVDMRKEKTGKGDLPLLSKRLQEAVHQRLDRKEQSILYLNRRGYATSVQCPSCGHVEECPHCSVAVTYHRANHQLRCHLCDHHRPVPNKCPACQFENYKFSGVGTQKIEDVAGRAFPNAIWRRVDSDSMRGKEKFEETLREFHDGKIDIMVGTQMIAKGLHFPNVTCVGVISVDGALNMPDFRASERVFQQLVQVAGRAGRGDLAGEVFFQTYAPFNPAIAFARHHDVDGFLEQELEYRKEHQFPPFTRAVLITFRGSSESKTSFCIDQVHKKLVEAKLPGVIMAEPAPAPIAKLKDRYRFHLFLRAKNLSGLTTFLRREIIDITWPEGVRASVNVDPYNLL